MLVANPHHNLKGDFALKDGLVQSEGTPRLTFSGIGCYHPALFAGLDPEQPAKLAPLLRSAMQQGRVSGECYAGLWYDIGTPARLQELDAMLFDDMRNGH